ncbi:MAG TPA: response regulator [Brevundimonas sp.]|nr:response regulator [Brevundimonas sp.]
MAGPPAWVYVLLFAASQLIGHWSVATYGAVAVWLSNGVMAAALLQLHRRPAIAAVAACFAINLMSNAVRGDPGMLVWLNAVMNLGEATLAAFLARRFCGAALDMRRPRRLVAFGLYAAAPAVAATAALGYGAVMLLRQLPMTPALVFKIYSFCLVELVGLLLVTPILLLLARLHRFEGLGRARLPESLGLLALVAGVTAVAFFQSDVPLAFLTILPMVLLALRLSPPWAAGGLVIVAAVSGAATLTGHGPVHLSRLADISGLETVPVLFRRLGVFNLYLLAMVAAILPLSTVMTERRRLEVKLRARTLAAQQARRAAEHALAARSRFLAMMSHEMRTPLNGVAGFADLLAAHPALDGLAAHQARQIRKAGDGLLMLVEDILDFARSDESLIMEPLELAAVAREAMTPSATTAEAAGLTLTIDDRLPPDSRFLTDRLALRRALQPLIANAVKFTATGEIVVRLDRSADGVCIRVSDTGCGIEAARLPELFEVFTQGDASIRRAHSGAGLGLALVALHVQRLGGAVHVDSRVGEGSTFSLDLPLERAPDADLTAPDVGVRTDDAALQTSPPAAGPPRVLVVDDHAVNREVARIMLEAFGCTVTEVCDGEDALDAVDGAPFDLVLMDVRMPRMDGLEATRRIRAMSGPARDLPVVAMTADAMPEDVARCLAAGMNGHMAKPVNQATLAVMVERALNGQLPVARVAEAA